MRFDTASRALRKRLDPSDVEARILQVQVAREPVHHVVVDHAVTTQLYDRRPLGLEQLAPHPLEARRAFLDLSGVIVVESGREAGLPELVGAAQTLGRVLAHLVRSEQLVEAVERRPGSMGPGLPPLARAALRR